VAGAPAFAAAEDAIGLAEFLAGNGEFDGGDGVELEHVEMARDDHAGADLEVLRKAYIFSAVEHKGQTRASGEPYLVHPLEVASLIADLRLDVPSVATGLLHDTVEDTLTTLEQVQSIFGGEIATLVDGVTKIGQINFTSRAERQAENFRKMIIAMARDIRVILIKLADRTHNMRTLSHLAPERQMEISQETLDVYAPLAHRLGIYWIKSELEDSSLRYLHPEVYYQLKRNVAKKRVEREEYIKHVITVLTKRLEEAGIEATVTGRFWSRLETLSKGRCGVDPRPLRVDLRVDTLQASALAVRLNGGPHPR